MTCDWCKDNHDGVRVICPRCHEKSKPRYWSLVIDDLYIRHHLGWVHGPPGSDTLRDAYNNAIDAAIELRREIHKRDGR